MPKHKKQRITMKQLAIIAIIIAVATPILIELVSYWNSLPHPNLTITLLNWTIYPTYNQDNTTFIRLNATFPAEIINNGNVPIHIVACDVFLTRNGKPSNISAEQLNEIAYLKPQDSFPYNFTKTFNVSIPVNEFTYGDAVNYMLLVVYYTNNPLDSKSVWFDCSKLATS
jgi:hypothetical protein